MLASAPSDSAPRLTAPPPLFLSANYETNVFCWPAKGQILHNEGILALPPSVTSFSRDEERSQRDRWADGRRNQIHTESDSPLAKSTTTEEPTGNPPPAHTADSGNAPTIRLSSSPTRAIVSAASQCLPLKGELERMARRRYQDPTPKRPGEMVDAPLSLG